MIFTFFGAVGGVSPPWVTPIVCPATVMFVVREAADVLAVSE
jgi:hypothetical protein